MTGMDTEWCSTCHPVGVGMVTADVEVEVKTESVFGPEVLATATDATVIRTVTVTAEDAVTDSYR